MKKISNSTLRDIIAVLRAFTDEPTAGSTKHRNVLRQARMLHGRLRKIDNSGRRRRMCGLLTLFRKKAL